MTAPRPPLTDAEYARLLPAADFELPPGFRVPTKAEFEQLLREPSTTSTAGPHVGGYLCIGYRSIPLTEDEARAFAAADPQSRSES